ncbi:MAG TPA: hypothetical protein VKB81_10095 [Nitrospira sp.]|nr:hypothetical protein [Nitrospira sp.]
MHKHFILALTMWFSADHALTYAEGGFIARVGASGEFLEMEDQHTGQIVKDYLPVHRAGEVRYFSAGVGVEERGAEYPPFSLKLVFTAGGKPYLTGVDVTIHPQMGGAEINIPREQIAAPWLFIDLPSGTYDVSAMYGEQKQTRKGITVVAGKQKTVQLQWAADRGSMVAVPNE